MIKNYEQLRCQPLPIIPQFHIPHQEFTVINALGTVITDKHIMLM